MQKGKDYRNLDNEEQLFTVTLDEALRIFAQPKVFRRGGQNMAAKGPLREFGTDPVSERPVVAKDGKFGVYVTDGETNASIGKGDRIEEMLPERAFELLADPPRDGRRQGRRDRPSGRPARRRPRSRRPRSRRPRSRRRPSRPAAKTVGCRAA